MKAPRTLASAWFTVVLAALVMSVSSCRFMPASQAQGMRTLFMPATPGCVLVVIASQDSLSAMQATGALVAASARPGEQVMILSSRGGAVLAYSQAPASPTLQVPASPAPLPSHPTSFQKARYQQAARQYQALVRHARTALRREQQQELAAWARSILARAQAQPLVRHDQTVSIGADLRAAVSDLSSLRQAGVGNGIPAVIAILGIDATAAQSIPTSQVALQSSTVVVDDFPGTSDQEASWQASLVQGGAARAVILTPATDDQLAPVVREGLDGAATDTLTNVLFGLGRAQVRAAALPQLRRLLHLLTVEYPQATASINGYTDDLPTPGGNLLLSQRRAQVIEQWLTAHGVAAGRLQAFGYGDTDPVAPNTATGQPLNRRVVVVIDPAI